MKKFILPLIIALLSLPAFSQEKKFSFSIGPELAFAAGSLTNTHSIGTGGSAQLEVLIQDKLKATASFGVLGYLGKSIMIGGQKLKQPGLTIIPVRVGAKYYLSGGIYGGAQIGVAFRGNYEPYNGAAFAYTPLILGYEFKTKKDQAIDASIKYDASSGHGGTIASFGIRLAYVF
ncbi:MAG: outer membrane beta-barrel protein [Ferruginibacter sp.]